MKRATRKPFPKLDRESFVETGQACSTACPPASTASSKPETARHVGKTDSRTPPFLFQRRRTTASSRSETSLFLKGKLSFDLYDGLNLFRPFSLPDLRALQREGASAEGEGERRHLERDFGPFMRGKGRERSVREDAGSRPDNETPDTQVEELVPDDASVRSSATVRRPVRCAPEDARRLSSKETAESNEHVPGESTSIPSSATLPRRAPSTVASEDDDDGSVASTQSSVAIRGEQPPRQAGSIDPSDDDDNNDEDDLPGTDSSQASLIQHVSVSLPSPSLTLSPQLFGTSSPQRPPQPPYASTEGKGREPGFKPAVDPEMTFLDLLSPSQTGSVDTGENALAAMRTLLAELARPLPPMPSSLPSEGDKPCSYPTPTSCGETGNESGEGRDGNKGHGKPGAIQRGNSNVSDSRLTAQISDEDKHENAGAGGSVGGGSGGNGDDGRVGGLGKQLETIKESEDEWVEHTERSTQATSTSVPVHGHIEASEAVASALLTPSDFWTPSRRTSAPGQLMRLGQPKAVDKERMDPERLAQTQTGLHPAVVSSTSVHSEPSSQGRPSTSTEGAGPEHRHQPNRLMENWALDEYVTRSSGRFVRQTMDDLVPLALKSAVVPTSWPSRSLRTDLDFPVEHLLHEGALERVLEHELGRAHFIEWCKGEGNGAEFKVDMWREIRTLDRLCRSAKWHATHLYHAYVVDNSLTCFPLEAENQGELNSSLNQIASLKPLLSRSQGELLRSLYDGHFKRYIRHCIAEESKVLLAKPHLSADVRSGLGDCFCLTNPRQPDNPVVAVSDRFVALTGYSRKEIVGRSCRFLQGPATAPDAVRRIRAALKAGRPCCELLINYRKDGKPFWCLLCIIPVRDDVGRLCYFIGGQVDVSGLMAKSTNLPWLMETYPTSTSELNDTASELERTTPVSSLIVGNWPDPPPVSPSVVQPPQQSAGTESALQDLTDPLEEQFASFRSMYSKVFILERRKRRTVFVSKELLQFLGLPCSTPKELYHSQLMYKDFLDGLTAGERKETKALKSKIKKGIRKGLPMSTMCGIRVGTDKSLGEDEGMNSRFGILHLTPLKNERNDVTGYIGVFV